MSIADIKEKIIKKHKSTLIPISYIVNSLAIVYMKNTIKKNLISNESLDFEKGKLAGIELCINAVKEVKKDYE